MPGLLELPVQLLDETFPALLKHYGQPVPWQIGQPPNLPGVYCWTTEQRIIYVGKGAPSLARRLAYQRAIDAHNPETHWQVTVIHMLKQLNATVQWITTGDEAEAELLERRLIEWHRACTGIAPVIVGWEAKKESPRYEAEQWARALWEEQP